MRRLAFLFRRIFFRKTSDHFSGKCSNGVARLAAIAVALLAAALLSATPLFAVEPAEMLKDPALEARARVLSKELRCMVCQNQSIDDSEAPLAHDLRVLVRERLTAGDSDAQVKDFLVARYGEFVLLKPPLSWHTAALWGLPPAILLLGVVAIVVVIGRRRSAAGPSEPVNLTAAEEKRLSELLHGEG
jgi:cytochrome c-type biogenesis protein CcmH